MGAAPMLQRNWLRSSLIGIRSLFHTKASRLITDETGQPVLIELTESAVKVRWFLSSISVFDSVETGTSCGEEGPRTDPQGVSRIWWLPWFPI